MHALSTKERTVKEKKGRGCIDKEKSGERERDMHFSFPRGLGSSYVTVYPDRDIAEETCFVFHEG